MQGEPSQQGNKAEITPRERRIERMGAEDKTEERKRQRVLYFSENDIIIILSPQSREILPYTTHTIYIYIMTTVWVQIAGRKIQKITIKLWCETRQFSVAVIRANGECIFLCLHQFELLCLSLSVILRFTCLDTRQHRVTKLDLDSDLDSEIGPDRAQSKMKSGSTVGYLVTNTIDLGFKLSKI